MRKIVIIIALFSLASNLFSQQRSDNCTSILVSKGASQDGSVMITYACDAEFLPNLRHSPAADHEEDEYIELDDWKGGTVKVKQVLHIRLQLVKQLLAVVKNCIILMDSCITAC